MNTVYTPGASDIAAGSVVLTLTSADNGTCSAASDVMTLTIEELPTADAGLDQEVCSETTVTLTGIIGGGASSLTWTTDGDGSFDDATSAGAEYTPDAADVGKTITFTLTTNANGTCPVAVDEMTVTFDSQPTAEAGENQTICETTASITMAGVIGGGVTGGTWTTAGDGTFGDPSVLNTVYTPGASDIAACLLYTSPSPRDS